MTLLPEPVAPAMSRCGILARSTAWALPATSRPRAKVSVEPDAVKSSSSRIAPQGDDVEVLVRDLDADRALARDRRLDPERPGGEGHRQVVGQRLDPADLDVRRRLDLVLGHDRAGVAADDLGRDVEARELLDDDVLGPPVDGLVAAGVRAARVSSSSAIGGRMYSMRSLVGGESAASVMSSGSRTGRDERSAAAGAARATGVGPARTSPRSERRSGQRRGCAVSSPQTPVWPGDGRRPDGDLGRARSLLGRGRIVPPLPAAVRVLGRAQPVSRRVTPAAVVPSQRAVPTAGSGQLLGAAG